MEALPEFFEPIVSLLDAIWAVIESLILDYGVLYAAVIVGAIYVIARAVLSGLSRTTTALISAIPTVVVIYCLLRWFNAI